MEVMNGSYLYAVRCFYFGFYALNNSVLHM